MPCTSIRDLGVKDDDPLIGTHGRSFWILDNVTSLREYVQCSGTTPVKTKTPWLFKPQTAIRVRWNMNTDTPMPPEEPGGQNPPDGAMIDYWLPKQAKSVVLEILDEANSVIRRYSSDDKPFSPDPKKIQLPTYWLRNPSVLSAEQGTNRWLGDMCRQPLGDFGGWVPMAAIVGDTPTTGPDPWAPPGKYTVRLTVDGKILEAPITLQIDPRVKDIKGVDLQSQISTSCYQKLKEIAVILSEVKASRIRLLNMMEANPELSVAEKLSAIDTKFRLFESDTKGISSLASTFESVMDSVSATEMAPTESTQTVLSDALKKLVEFTDVWHKLRNDPHLKP